MKIKLAKSMLITSYACMVIASALAVAGEPDRSVFGVPIGEPLSIRRCEKGEVVTKATCYTPDPYGSPDAYGREQKNSGHVVDST